MARRVRRPDTTTPPGEASTPTDGLLRSATSAGRPTQLLFSWRRRSTSSEREKPKAVTSPWKNEEADRAQTSAIPTAVLPGQECARGRHTHTPSGRHPLVRNAAEKDASPPRQKSSSAVTGAQKSASSPSCRARSGGGWGSVTRRLQACRCGPSPHAAGRRLPPASRTTCCGFGSSVPTGSRHVARPTNACVGEHRAR